MSNNDGFRISNADPRAVGDSTSNLAAARAKLKAGRPVGSGSSNNKLMRVLITPRQERLFAQMRESDIGMSESEHVRRALDDYIDKLIARGELIDYGPGGKPV